MNDVLKRLHMRSWRRGMKEMDLILGPWADTHLADLPQESVAIYDKILQENDQDLLAWMLGQQDMPEGPMKPLIVEIADFAKQRFRER